MTACARKKVLLMILDGWGIGRGDRADVIGSVRPQRLGEFAAKYPHAELRTDGENVGLPDGQMGNSEVGHLNIGAGRVLYQDLVKINRAVADGSIGDNPEVKALIDYCREKGCALHVMGLLSDGGVHSLNSHMYAFLRLAKAAGLEKVYVHGFLDGRDTDPKSGEGFVKDMLAEMARPDTAGELVSLVGRYWAMDRDKRWERVRRAYDLLVKGVGNPVADMPDAVRVSYRQGITDEFLEPQYLTDGHGVAVGRIRPHDAVVFVNFRNDRAKELTTVLTQEARPDFEMEPLPLYFCTMTPYDPTYKGLHVLFPKENVVNTIGEWVSAQGLRQLRIAETEKYAHVTFFLNGGREAPYEGEDRILVPSPSVATYDLQPQMSAPEVTEKLVEAIATEQYDFICLNFANGDMVGHTGVYDAIEKAVVTVDACAGAVIDAARDHGYEVVQIADHGNADNAVNADGSPNTAHSLNPVPILVVSDRVERVENGVLADVAPTVLTLMGLPIPPEMTGRVLVTMRFIKTTSLCSPPAGARCHSCIGFASGALERAPVFAGRHPEDLSEGRDEGRGVLVARRERRLLNARLARELSEGDEEHVLQAPVAEGESRLGLHLAAERAHAHARKRSPVLHHPLGLLKGGELHFRSSDAIRLQA